MRVVPVLWLSLVLLAACSSSVAPKPPAKPPAQRAGAAPAPPPPDPRFAAADPGNAPPVPRDAVREPTIPLVTNREVRSPGRRAPEPPKPDETLEGGEIPRSTLLAVLSNGIGRFLQKVRAEPHLVGGRFIGWRILSMFDSDAATRAGALQPGDTVMRVNGQSIERPEQFKNVWDSMATQSELVLLVQRAGKHNEVRYRIVE